MREIEIETFLRQMGQGVTRPALVIGDDYEEYIIKNEGVDDTGQVVKYDCMFINELLAFQIGLYLGVPMPEAVVAIIDSEFINDNPMVRFTYRFEAGKYFASKRLLEVENNLVENYEEQRKMNKPYVLKTWNKFFQNIENKSDAAKIIAFDMLIGNFDRYNNEGNILIDNSNGRKIYAIDHGHAFFGPFWNETKINCLRTIDNSQEFRMMFASNIVASMRRSGICSNGTIFSSLQQFIDLDDVDNHSFDEVVSRMMQITPTDIRIWCENIPEEWYINKELQISLYTNFIMKNKYNVAWIIQALAIEGAFINYRGGELKWSMTNKEFHTV